MSKCVNNKLYNLHSTPATKRLTNWEKERKREGRMVLSEWKLTLA